MHQVFLKIEAISACLNFFSAKWQQNQNAKKMFSEMFFSYHEFTGNCNTMEAYLLTVLF